MNDEMNLTIEQLKQHASGVITYGVPVAGDTITVGATLLTCVAATPGAGEFSSIAELELLIEAISGLSSAVVDGTIVVEKDAPGSAGDAILLSLGGLNTGTMLVSAPNLQGGVDFTVTEKFQLTNDVNPIQVDSVINILSLSAGGTVTITPQTSLDGDTWVDRTASAALNAIGVSELHTTEPLTYWRYKIVLGGTKPVASINIKARKSN